MPNVRVVPKPLNVQSLAATQSTANTKARAGPHMSFEELPPYSGNAVQHIKVLLLKPKLLQL